MAASAAQNAFFFKHEEEDDSFRLVETTSKVSTKQSMQRKRVLQIQQRARQFAPRQGATPGQTQNRGDG